MKANLWSANHPRNFWQCLPQLPDDVWDEAIKHALPILGLPESIKDVDTLLEFTLGEAQFGADRYQIGFVRRLYYGLKPFLPRFLIYLMRRVYGSSGIENYCLGWPVELRYAQFQWGVLRQVMQIMGTSEITIKSFWPGAKQFAFVLTHDVETSEGQKCVPVLADLEESLGFRSLFNFVPERYALDQGLLTDLRQRGFEIGVHGLKHDGKLFNSYSTFMKRAPMINRYFSEFKALGFRSPLTHRNPEWMQLLEMEYDLSFFDTDPLEPFPGGVMSIWPFYIGRFLELPYTLPQDCTMFNILGKQSPALWLEKIARLEQYNGMVLALVHPDYSSVGVAYKSYKTTLEEVKAHGRYWHTLPREMTRWWRCRTSADAEFDGKDISLSRVTLTGDGLQITDLPKPDEVLLEKT